MTKQFLSIAVPTVSQCFLQRLTMIINTIFVGRINDVSKLAGVGLATTISCILLVTILEGMNGALETLVSQAFGFGQLHLCGVYFNRGRMILTAIFIPLAILLSFSEPILITLGQDPIVSKHAHSFILATLPALYFYVMFDLTKRFLNCMTISFVPATA